VQSEAVQLFSDRAALVEPGFSVTHRMLVRWLRSVSDWMASHWRLSWRQRA
jgi:hypothetical protein